MPNNRRLSILLFFSIWTITLADICPEKCTCKDFNNYASLLNFKQLTSLDLSNNQLNSLDFSALSDFSLPSLIKLVLDDNKLASITRQSFIIFPNVEEISVKHNGIFAIDWEAFRLFRLKRLYLGWNHLPTISEHMLRFTPNLEMLDLSHNQISIAQSSSFFAAQHLKHIDLSFNRIQRFFYDSFSPLFQLETLDLSYNNLSSIPWQSNRKVCVGELVQPVLETLNISHCPKLRLIEARAFAKLPLLQTTILANNPMLNFISPSAFKTFLRCLN
uniref:Uncharacterized protein n=1 Tax=Ditylenchus dipsaci TaxID=166011 RepID=A0A915E3V4_9BILA